VPPPFRNWAIVQTCSPGRRLAENPMHSQPRGLARELEQFALVVVRVDQIVSRIAELSAPSHPFSPAFSQRPHLDVVPASSCTTARKYRKLAAMLCAGGIGVAPNFTSCSTTIQPA